MDTRLRRKLRDFGRALSEAISDSTEATRRLNELRDEGYSLYLLLDGSGEDAGDEGAEARQSSGSGGRRQVSRSGATASQALARSPRRLPAPRDAPAAGECDPSFRINGEDLALLRSLGIDPTRTVRRRKSG